MNSCPPLGFSNAKIARVENNQDYLFVFYQGMNHQNGYLTNDSPCDRYCCASDRDDGGGWCGSGCSGSLLR